MICTARTRTQPEPEARRRGGGRRRSDSDSDSRAESLAGPGLPVTVDSGRGGTAVVKNLWEGAHKAPAQAPFCERGEPDSAYDVVWNGEQAAREGETMRLVSHTFLGLSLNAARCQSHAAHTPLPIFELHATSHTAPEATAGSS